MSKDISRLLNKFYYYLLCFHPYKYKVKLKEDIAQLKSIVQLKIINTDRLYLVTKIQTLILQFFL